MRFKCCLENIQCICVVSTRGGVLGFLLPVAQDLRCLSANWMHLCRRVDFDHGKEMSGIQSLERRCHNIGGRDHGPRCLEYENIRILTAH